MGRVRASGVAGAVRTAVAAVAVLGAGAAWAATAVGAEAAGPRSEALRSADRYVKAGAESDGDGSRRSPFASLAELERAARPGQKLVVLPPAEGAGPLDGGIVLQRDQRLIGAGRSVRRERRRNPVPELTNTTAANHGDAVRLAEGSRVRNLRITGTRRGAIYGLDVSDVVVAGNDIAGHNVSCAKGFQIPAFQVPTTVPGAGIPISGLSNGWAGILLDATSGSSRVVIRRNRVRDAECGDGIDVRAMERAWVDAVIGRNFVTGLRQGPEFESLLAFGLQTSGEAVMRARLGRNRQSELGNEEDPGIGPEGADSEGVFVNPTEGSRLDAKITRNEYRNPRNLGGFSANGMEFVTMGDGARGRVEIRDSRFSGTPGDVLEQFALGTNAKMSMELTDVVARRSSGFAGTGFGHTVVIPANNSDCLVAASGGAGNVIETTLERTELTDCANNGLTFGSAVANGSGPTESLSLEVRDSVITGNRGANLRVANLSDLSEVRVLVEGTDLSDSGGGNGSGLGNATFEELGSTEAATLDIGGGALGGGGENCLGGGLLAAEVVGYEVSAAGNWWGAPGGPAPGRTAVAGGSLDTSGSLSAPATACSR